ncbi:Synaptosomal-associated protein 25, partial [Gryllus bimaculatus]
PWPNHHLASRARLARDAGESSGRPRRLATCPAPARFPAPPHPYSPAARGRGSRSPPPARRAPAPAPGRVVARQVLKQRPGAPGLEQQLDRIEEGMDQINADMREAEKNLTGMEKCCGLCVLPCNKSSTFKEDEGTWKGNDDGKVVNNQPQRVMDDRNGLGPQGGYIAKVTNDARESEMEENMGQVNTMIGNLRNMALDMGSELQNQNSQIDRINRKGASNETRIAVANQRAHELMK